MPIPEGRDPTPFVRNATLRPASEIAAARAMAQICKRHGVQIVGDDYLACGNPYRELSEYELVKLWNISVERLCALNGLCWHAECRDQVGRSVDPWI